MWRRNRPRSRFPADMLARLDLLGRYELDMHGSGIDGSAVYSTCVAPFHEEARADPETFCAALDALVAGDTRGFPGFGASRLVFELLDEDQRRSPAALALVDRGIEFKRSRGLPTAALTGHEWNRWLEEHTPESWWDRPGHAPV